MANKIGVASIRVSWHFTAAMAMAMSVIGPSIETFRFITDDDY